MTHCFRNIAAATLVGLVSQTMARERLIDFEKDRLDYPPESFIIEAPETLWQSVVLVQKDPAEGAKSRVLALQGASAPEMAPLLNLIWFSNVRDGSLSVDLKHLGEEKARKVLRKAGLVWRYQSREEYYSLEWDALESILTLSVTTGGKREILREEDFRIPAQEWTSIRVEFRGDSIQCDLGGKRIFKVTDSRLKKEGKVGILLQSDVVMYFDNFRVKAEDAGHDAKPETSRPATTEATPPTTPGK